MKRLLLIFLVSVGLIFPQTIMAAERTINCPDRYVTLVNPIRSREYWLNKTLEPLNDQYTLIDQHHFSATWLLQDDIFNDKELVDRIDQFNKQQEFGIFLEVSPQLAQQAKVIYPYDAAWFSPRVIFLSGYSQSDRKRLIDTMFAHFYNHFGFYPKAVGAWWIDSYSLDYLKEKYNIQTAVIVADQLTTDNYGIWGQWWGVPYYPSKTNILVPAQSMKDKEDVVVVQWAQRDLDKAYGKSPTYSNYSLQANDYIRQGENTNYFINLASQYLDCHLPVGQITVGLETGIESVDYIKEYKNQLDWIASQPALQTKTLSQFAQEYGRISPQVVQEVRLRSDHSEWMMDQKGRKNEVLRDNVHYHQGISFADYFIADNNDFLQRNLHQLDDKKDGQSAPFYLLVFVISFYFFFKKNKLKQWTIIVIFTFATFGLALRSFQQFGWYVWFGPHFTFLELTQIVLVTVTTFILYLLSKKTSLWIYILLGFAIDYFTGLLRYSYISGNRIFGISTDALHFIGFGVGKSIVFLNTDLPAYQAAALLRFPFQKLNTNGWWYFVFSPLLHILLGLFIGVIISKLSPKFRKLVLYILGLGVIFYLMSVINADPASVTMR